MQQAWLAAFSPKARSGWLGWLGWLAWLVLAVPLLFAVKAAGQVVAVRVVAKGGKPDDWNQLAVVIVHLGRFAMLSDERWKL